MIDTCPSCALAHQVETLSAVKTSERQALKMSWLAGGIVNDTDETSIITIDGVISPEHKAELLRIVKEIDAANAVKDEGAEPSHYAECCNCGAQVDTREVEDGGNEHGAQFSDGDWVCSSECWEVAK
jgi:hypothetical protein